MKVPLFGSSGVDIESDNSSQLSQNLYPHFSQTGKSKVTMNPTPGRKAFANVGLGPIRGDIEYNDLHFVMSGDQLYEIASDGTATARGSAISTSIGHVSMAHNGAANGSQILIATGTNGYIWNSTYSTLSQIKLFSSGTADTDTANKLEDSGATFSTDGVVAGTIVYNTTDGTSGTVSAVDSETVLSIVDSTGTALDLFPDGNETYEVGDDDYPDTATHASFFDSYFIVNNPSVTGRFAKSASYDGTRWDILEIATAERSPDKLQALIVSNRQLWLIGTKTAEKWFNSGAADFPFEPDQSGFSEWGTIAPFSLLEIAGFTFWLSQNDEGAGMVVATTGGNPQVMSSPEISAEIQKLSKLTDAYALAYQRYQHTFYILTFPTAQKTFAYDILTQQWFTIKTESTGYWRATTHTYVFDKHLTGDPINGNITELDWSTYTDNGEQITRIRRTQNIHADDKSVRHHGVWIDIKEAVANDDVTDPQILLRWKDNNGPWSNYHSRSMGKTGEHNKKCVWRGLGRSRDRVYEISVTDAVNTVLVDGYAKLEGDPREFG